MHDGSVIHEVSAENYVVPADDKENAQLIISEIILDVFNGLKWLTPSPGRTALDMQSACEVKPYLDENRRERKMLGERRFD
jgi:hypothetical protein